ncbi:protein unc-13 homolog C-like [Epinephelus moara]|uniref:protein unc-13 homolog C-like n=1 Tax=Epinephelus moara TaxID=300413 RepID=UPI00214E1469|nr:protein unc-13 homolog C-like [Epinephelus moara]
MSDTQPDREQDRNSSTPHTKRFRPFDSIHISPHKTCCAEVSDILISINTNLSGLDARIGLIEILHKEFQHLRESHEFSQHQIETVTKENRLLHTSVNMLNTRLNPVAKQNKEMKETILDLQSCSMRDNLVFSGIPERTQDDSPEQLIQDFMTTHLKISLHIVKDITCHRVHRIGPKNPANKRPRPIVAKFEHFKHKLHVQRHCRQLKGTGHGLNDQFPQEILDRRSFFFFFFFKIFWGGIFSLSWIGQTSVKGGERERGSDMQQRAWSPRPSDFGLGDGWRLKHPSAKNSLSFHQVITPTPALTSF